MKSINRSGIHITVQQLSFAKHPKSLACLVTEISILGQTDGQIDGNVSIIAKLLTSFDGYARKIFSNVKVVIIIIRVRNHTEKIKCAYEYKTTML